MPDGRETIHGSCAAISGRGVLLLGPAGSGKSDLLLRLIDGGADLVADDRVALRADGAGVWAAAPERLAGLIEVRGLGIVALPHLTEAPVALAVRLAPAEEIERLPEPEAEDLLPGLSVPRLRLDPWQASAPARLRLALEAMTAGRLMPPDFRPR